MTLHFILASHNRKKETLSTIGEIIRQAKADRIGITLTVLDDGSTDGTFEALSYLVDKINVLTGDGHFYWAKSMRVCEQFVFDFLGKAGDHLVWINDDVKLFNGVLKQVKNDILAFPRSTIVYSTKGANGQTTYSGLRKTGFNPLSYERVSPENLPLKVDTFNGNFVVIPIAMAKKLGGIDGSYPHGLADFDFGLRLKANGYEILLSNTVAGICERNGVEKQNLLASWKSYRSIKGGGNLRALMIFFRRHSSAPWPFWVIVTYSTWWIKKLLEQIATQTPKIKQ